MPLPFTNDIRTLRFLAGEMTQGDLGGNKLSDARVIFTVGAAF